MPTQQQADNLNDRYDQLSEKLDLLDKVPADKASTVNATIADWQDYYWGPGVDMGFSQLVDYEGRYITAAQLVDGLATQTTKQTRVEDTQWFKADVAARAANPRAPIPLPPLLVTAVPPRPPQPPPYVPPPAVHYTPAPMPPPPPLPPMTMGAVDTEAWGTVTPDEAQAYARAPGNAPWQPPESAPQRGGKGGLLAVVVMIATGIYGKQSGWF